MLASVCAEDSLVCVVKNLDAPSAFHHPAMAWLLLRLPPPQLLLLLLRLPQSAAESEMAPGIPTRRGDWH